jgi:hypothetical protein
VCVCIYIERERESEREESERARVRESESERERERGRERERERARERDRLSTPSRSFPSLSPLPASLPSRPLLEERKSGAFQKNDTIKREHIKEGGETYGADGLFVGREDAGAFGTVFDRVPCAFPRE